MPDSLVRFWTRTPDWARGVGAGGVPALGAGVYAGAEG
jgi:hypothetical protein